MTQLEIVRKHLGLTQEQMGHLLGVTNTSIWRWEQKVGEPSEWHHALLNAFAVAAERKSTIGVEAIRALSVNGVAKALFCLLQAAFAER